MKLPLCYYWSCNKRGDFVGPSETASSDVWLQINEALSYPSLVKAIQGTARKLVPTMCVIGTENQFAICRHRTIDAVPTYNYRRIINAIYNFYRRDAV
eukprot:sb/3478957/